jgi:hypothetical protein
MYPADNASEQEKDGKKDGSWVLAGFVICALSGATEIIDIFDDLLETFLWLLLAAVMLPVCWWVYRK